MKDRILRIFTHNIGLKLLAVFFAVLLWLVVVNVDNPSQSRSFTATVQVVNEDLLTAQGKYYTIKNNENTVSFRVTARRSVMEQLSSSDFTATADMANLENDSRIPVEITANRYAGSVTVAGSTKYLEIEVGEQRSVKFIINGETTGKPDDGYAISKVSVSPNVITISGPADRVSRIDSVVAICNVDNISSDISESVVPTLLDSLGDVVDTTGLEMSENTVNVSVSMQSVKDVAVEVETSGELAEGLTLKEIKTDPGTIRIMGQGSVINDITEVVIPNTVIDLSKITESMETSVDIATYLPEGVTLMEDSSAKVTISVDVSEIVTREIEIPVSQITLSGKQSDYEYTFPDDYITLSVTGSTEVVEALKASSFKTTLDVSDLAVGSHVLTVDWGIEDEDYEVSETEVDLEISEKQSAASTDLILTE